MKFIKRLTSILAAGMVAIGFAGNAGATTFAPIEKIGVFVEGPHPTIARGYTEATDKFLTFGDGQFALKVGYTKNEQGKIGRFAGVYVEELKLHCKYLGNNIYRTMADNGLPVYIAIGGPGVEQDFSLIAKYNGKSWHIMDINVLKKYIPKIDRLDYQRAVYLLEPSTKGNTITIPFGILDEDNRSYKNIGEFRLVWDDSAGWFGLAKFDY